MCVSTDSLQIAQVSKIWGRGSSFAKKFATDFTTTEQTLKNALYEFENFYKTKFDICVLTSTNIFRKIS